METQPEKEPSLPNNTEPIKAPSRETDTRERRTEHERGNEGRKPGEKSPPDQNWNELDLTKKGVGGATGPGSAVDQPIH